MAIAEQDKPKKRFGEGLDSFIDRLGEILAFFTVCLIAFLYIEGQWSFISSSEVIGTLWAIREIAIIVVVGMKGMEMVLKGRSFLFFLIYAAIFAVVIIFAFFPQTGIALVAQIRSATLIRI